MTRAQRHLRATARMTIALAHLASQVRALRRGYTKGHDFELLVACAADARLTAHSVLLTAYELAVTAPGKKRAGRTGRFLVASKACTTGKAARQK